MNDRLKLPLAFDASRLQDDLRRLSRVGWTDHFVKQNYEGQWSAIPLRAPAGATHPIAMIYPSPNDTGFVDTPLLAQCPYFQEVLAAFECPLDAVRLMRLAPGSQIKEHRDNDLDPALGKARLHIPVTTNPDVEFFLNGRQVVMNAGECWFLRLADPHRVVNRGQADRVHLVIDVAVNDWMRRILEGCDADAGADGAVAPVSSQATERNAARDSGGPPAAAAACTFEFVDNVPFDDPTTRRIVDFVTDIGLRIRTAHIHGQTILPGITVAAGTLVVDVAKMKYPGDLIHEAGHLAVIPPERRGGAGADVGNDGGEEIAAIAWSYAAAVHLDLDPAIVFHADGYRGGSQAIIDNFTQGHYIGVPILQWLGMTCDARTAAARGVPAYPHMTKWLGDRPVPRVTT